MQTNKLQKWTLIREEIPFYVVFKLIKLVACLLTTVLYPIYNVTGYPKFGEFQLFFLIILEGVFFVEIVVNFFMQPLDEQGISKSETLENIASMYLRGGFALDFIVLLPLG